MMQDRYVGDIGDFGKFGLLKSLISVGFYLGVNWYKAEPPESEKDRDTGVFLHEDGKHKIKATYFPCDESLAKALRDISEHESRSIDKLENASLLEPSKTIYYNKVIPVVNRNLWHREALQKLSACDLVFLDPDNGLKVKSVGKGSAKIVKYVLEEELSDYLRRGQSVVLYNHRPRKQEEVYFREFAERFSQIDAVGDKRIFAITFPKGTLRDYFLIAANDDHAARIASALNQMNQGLWGKLGLCRIQPFEVC